MWEPCDIPTCMQSVPLHAASRRKHYAKYHGFPACPYCSSLTSTTLELNQWKDHVIECWWSGTCTVPLSQLVNTSTIGALMDLPHLTRYYLNFFLCFANGRLIWVFLAAALRTQILKTQLNTSTMDERLGGFIIWPRLLELLSEEKLRDGVFLNLEYARLMGNAKRICRGAFFPTEGLRFRSYYQLFQDIAYCDDIDDEEKLDVASGGGCLMLNDMPVPSRSAHSSSSSSSSRPLAASRASSSSDTSEVFSSRDALETSTVFTFFETFGDLWYHAFGRIFSTTSSKTPKASSASFTFGETLYSRLKSYQQKEDLKLQGLIIKDGEPFTFLDIMKAELERQ